MYLNSIEPVYNQCNQELFELYVKQELEERQRKKDIVSSKDYEDWIYNYLYYHNCIHDESMLYTCEGKDQEYGKICSYYHDYLIKDRQLPRIDIPEEHGFGHFYTPFKIKDKEYIIQTLIGQGATTWITTKEGAFIGE